MSTFTQSIITKLENLRLIDKEFRAFGAADSHRYMRAPVLTEDQLKDFEKQHDVQLPPDYRDFLSQVCNGYVGPFYGLIDLENAVQGCRPGIPFPFPVQSVRLGESDQAQWKKGSPGIVLLCHQGCGYYNFLVTKGEHYGKVWNDFLAADGRLTSTNQTFSQWYEAWIDRITAQIPNIALKEKINIGMSRVQLMEVMENRNFQEWRRDGWLGYGIQFEHVPLDIRLNEDQTVGMVFDQPIV
jgi:hypothetical protein